MTVTQHLSNTYLWFWILSSVFNGFAYTGGPYPLGYLGLENVSIAYTGLGDVFVFVYFGQVASLMLPYLMSVSSSSSHDDDIAATIDWKQQILYSTQVGLLATNIIVVNNLRDRHTDVAAQKRTTAVRFGRNFSLAEYTACVAISYALVLVDYIFLSPQYTATSMLRLLPLATLPLAVRETRAVFRKEGPALNVHVGGTAKVQFAFCILLSVSLWFS
jgi:1,4-dihydroxy-2-naphthoate octaprenyltransferase